MCEGVWTDRGSVGVAEDQIVILPGAPRCFAILLLSLPMPEQSLPSGVLDRLLLRVEAMLHQVRPLRL